MRLLDFNSVFTCILVLVLNSFSFGQQVIDGTIIDASSGIPIENVLIYSGKEKTQSNIDGTFVLTLDDLSTSIVTVSKDSYQIVDLNLKEVGFKNILIELRPVIELNTIEINANAKKAFSIRRMKEVEETKIIAGKKNEVILLNASSVNLATNNARQIYSQIVGLNIFEYNDGGLQLGIGGRGLDPNRTANFNTRQNDYDISADVLGYPESYYTPPAEALEEIQIIRGAASLQYGTQFGGLINFKFKKPVQNKPIELIMRNTIGSFGLFTNFTELSGTVGSFSYYAFNNYKKGNGYRPNSNFEANNYHVHAAYQFSDQTSLSAEFTQFHYLAKQAGGLTDQMFYDNPRFSNRDRNWFEVDWNLFDTKFKHIFDNDAVFTTHIFGLKATRKALGFRSPRIIDLDEEMNPRDLIVGEFNNWGIESRFLTPYYIRENKNIILFGAKYYHANNASQQGPGNNGSEADYDFYTDKFGDYNNQSKLKYPNRNLALFAENIFRISDKLSVTPGIRFEILNTKADGEFTQIEKNLSDEIIDKKIIPISSENYRNIFLVGLGIAYEVNSSIESYTNFSQNYRSVTYNDIHTISSNRFVSPDISDEKGYTWDFGIRGQWKNYISYDTNTFLLYYDNKIGNYRATVGEFLGKVGRDNIGTAVMYGLETFVDFNLSNILPIPKNKWSINLFFNGAYTHSEYTNVEVATNDIKEGKRVEFVPNWNIKSGVGVGYNNVNAKLLFTYLSIQYTDAQNTVVSENYTAGILGQIPAYNIVDFSINYRLKRFQLEGGINNLLDKSYFARRADGYPGPGIIPSDPRTFYTTLTIRLF